MSIKKHNYGAILLTILLLLFVSTRGFTQDTQSNGKIIMAIFAHADDEIAVAPILSKYAREGAMVYLVTVTDGRLGTGQSGLSTGQELVDLRIEELKCSAEKLGIQTPIWLGYHDQLRLSEGFFGHVPYAQDLIYDLDSLISAYQPEVLITWGPDGGSNHMDHRIVGATVTQVAINKSRGNMKLFYYAVPTQSIEEPKAKLLRGVDEVHISHRVPYQAQDAEKAIAALNCYLSQFSAEVMKKRASKLRASENVVQFRQFAIPSVLSTDLFD